jgi:uncharacterized protein
MGGFLARAAKSGADLAQSLRQGALTPPALVSQTWTDLLFAHWRARPAEVRALIPRQLELDTQGGHAWVTLALLDVSSIRPLDWLPVPGDFPQLNLRTYVRFGGVAGVYFLALEAGQRTAALAARTLYGLPFSYADLSMRASERNVTFVSRQSGLRCVYSPKSEPSLAPPGSLSHWLLERYTMFSVRGRRVFRADIEHAPWRVSEARAVFEWDSDKDLEGYELEGVPRLVQYAARQEARVGRPRPVEALKPAGPSPRGRRR